MNEDLKALASNWVDEELNYERGVCGQTRVLAAKRAFEAAADQYPITPTPAQGDWGAAIEAAVGAVYDAIGGTQHVEEVVAAIRALRPAARAVGVPPRATELLEAFRNADTYFRKGIIADELVPLLSASPAPTQPAQDVTTEVVELALRKARRALKYQPTVEQHCDALDAVRSALSALAAQQAGGQ